MPAAKARRPLVFRLVRAAGIVMLALLAFGAGIWATLAIDFSNLPWSWLRMGLAVGFVVGSCAVFVFARPCRRALLIYACAFAAVLIWYYLIPPSNNRDWQPDVARTPTIDIQGDHIVVHNVRNCTYRSETDFDVKYEDRSYDLSKLQSLDLVMSYWGPRNICHTFVCFDFGDGQYLDCSIETRKEKGEGYSALKGCFRQFELIYIFADERDVIGLRTDHRKEDVYLYHLPTPTDRARKLFVDYARHANEMATTPVWYNAITESCGTSIIYHAWAARGDSPFRLRWLFNGRWDEYAYNAGLLDTSIPFETLRERSRINGRVLTTDPNFSARLREGLPLPPPGRAGN